MTPRIAKLATLLAMSALSEFSTFAQTCKTINSCPPKRVEPESRRIEPESENHRENWRESQSSDSPPRNHPSSHIEPQNSFEETPNRSNTVIYRPEVVTATIGHAMTYNTRPGGVHIDPEYFASHYGPSHGFHFIQGPPSYGLTLFNGEWYFDWNGGIFGVIGLLPGHWGLQNDYLYIDLADDGNYYLYDTQFPGFAVQLTFVQNIGDDQADSN